MKYGIVHHIAGNIDALRDIDRKFAVLGVDSKICLGDIVGLYPFVNETVEFLVQQQYRVVKNWQDSTFVEGGPYIGWSTVYLVQVHEYARPRTSAFTLEYLKSLPSQFVERGWRFTSRFSHVAVPGGFLNHEQDVKAAFRTCTELIVFHGSHWEARIWGENCLSLELSPGKHTMDRAQRRLVSPGTLGCRYGGPVKHPSAIVFDDEVMTIEVLRPKLRTENILRGLRTSDYPRGALLYLTEHEFSDTQF